MRTALLGIIAVGLVVYAAHELVPGGLLGRRRRTTSVTRRTTQAVVTPLSVRRVLALVPLWVVITLWETDPLYKNLAVALPSGMDMPVFAWNLWWMKFALLDLHQSPFFTNYIYAPQQVNLAFHTFTPLNGLLSIPLQLLVGLPAALDLLLLANFVASQLGTFLLVRQETGSDAGAFVGSVVFPFAPYVMAHLNAGHINIVTTWAVPFFALFLLRWLRQGRARDAAAAGISLGCVGLNDLNQLSYCVAFGILVVLYRLVRSWVSTWQRGKPSSPLMAEESPPGGETAVAGAASPIAGAVRGQEVRGWLLGLGAFGGTSLVVLLPELIPFVDGLRHGWTTATDLQSSEDFAPDLAGYITPLFLHPVWGSWAAGISASLHFLDWPKTVFLGFTALTLSLVALLQSDRSRIWPWWGMTVLFWLLSLGPHLHAWNTSQFTAFGAQFTVPLPYLLYHAIPLIGGGRIPGYASVIVALGLAVLAGYGAAWLSRLLPRRWERAVLAAIAAFLVLFESLSTPLPLWVPQPDPVYAQIGREPGRQAVLDAPLGWRDGRIGVGSEDNGDMYWGTVSRKPLVEGFSARVPDSYFQYYQTQPALTAFYAPEGPSTPQSQNGPLVRATLRRVGVGYIVVHRSPYYEQLAAYVRNVVRAAPFYQDADLTAFRMPSLPAGHHVRRIG